MSKQTIVFSAILSTLLFSGVAFGHGVQSDSGSDMMYGHSADHKDSALMRSSAAQAPEKGHSDGDDSTDILHDKNVHGKKLTGSPSSPPDRHHSNRDNAPDLVHETRDH